MQIQSNPTASARSGEWVARTDTPSRSVYPNYRAPDGMEPHGESAPAGAPCSVSLQESIDSAMARSFLFRALALVFQDPDRESWSALCSPEQLECFAKAAQNEGLGEPASNIVRELGTTDFDHYSTAHFAVFGHAARGRCPLNEIEYGDVKADPLFQPHRLADLAAFYRAFGLELAADADERQDHISMELEFMSVLAAKEAYAIENQNDDEELSICRDAQKKFLREHLGRWLPAFTRRLAAAAEHPLMRQFADFTRLFVERECSRCSVKPGSDDMLLRPVDEAAENMCASCGLGQLPPGASAPPAV